MFASPRIKWEAQIKHKNVYCTWALLEWDDTTFLYLVIYLERWSHCSTPSDTDTEAGCTSPPGLWAQRKPTVRNLSEDRYWNQCLAISHISCLLCQCGSLRLNQNTHSATSDLITPCSHDPSSDPLLPSYLHVIKHDNFFSGIQGFSKSWAARQVGLVSVVTVATHSKNAIANWQF